MQIFSAMFYYTEIWVQKEKYIFLKVQIASIQLFGEKSLSYLKFILSCNQNLPCTWKADDEHGGVLAIVSCHGCTGLKTILTNSWKDNTWHA